MTKRPQQCHESLLGDDLHRASFGAQGLCRTVWISRRIWSGGTDYSSVGAGQAGHEREQNGHAEGSYYGYCRLLKDIVPPSTKPFIHWERNHGY